MVVARYNPRPVMSARTNLEPVQAYCREARRLRYQLRHSPARMHRSLSELRPAAVVPEPETITPNDRFAVSVVASIEGQTLRYSQRLQLLREAKRLGIERFEANLIIAMVQHRLANAPAPIVEETRSVPTWLIV